MMLSHKLPANGKEITLSGDQIWFIRSSLGLSQADLAARLAVSQPSIFRFEKREQNVGPEIILLDSIAKALGIVLPYDPIDREDPMTTAAISANLERVKQQADQPEDGRGIFDSGTKLTYATDWPGFVVHHSRG